MKVKKRTIQKAYLVGMICIIAVFFMMPQFLMPAYGETGTGVPTIQGSNAYDLSKSSYYVTEGGNYTFTGETTEHNIKIYAKKNLPDNHVTITLRDVKINLQGGDERPAIEIQEETNVTIILEGDNYLNGGKRDKLLYTDDGYAGISVHNTSELTIIGNGYLKADGWPGRRGAAGIGGNYDNSSGKITIGNGTDNPTVEAYGGGRDGGDDGAAGIGGGYDGQASNGITINSGTVTAIGGNGAAGIGGGQADGGGSGGKAENITINGGNVTATGGEDAAGIGGGESGTSGEGGNVTGITITGGTVIAKGGSSGAGIGGSKDAVAKGISINGGDITALGGDWAAGIGGGNAVGTGSGGKIEGLTITRGTIKAGGGGAKLDENGNIVPGSKCGAGIGGSDKGGVSGLVINEQAKNSLQITAVGGDRGAGIGNANSGEAGNDGITQNDIGNISITLNGGTITATGGYGGAGIGGGNSKADNIEIYGSGTINATGGDYSSAIGAGKNEDGGDITIEGTTTDKSRDLTIEARATKSSGDNDAAVIGGADSKGGDITISNATIALESPYNCSGAAIGSGANAKMIAEGMGNITITNCSITDGSSRDRTAASIGAGFSSLVDNITITGSVIEGGTIGGTDNGNQVFTDPCIDSISITDSIVTADNAHGQRAAIGSGRFEGIDAITISNSTVTAKTVSGAGIGTGGYSSSGTGDALKWTGNACGSITITKSNITAEGNDGGAGIGGGWGTPVGEVKITDSTVTATGGDRKDSQGGAGIGGGWCESTDDITISNSKVTATGAKHSAGIGSSGGDTSSVVMWNTTCNSISIKNGSDVNATGGSGGAGIGTGYGAQYGSYARITIGDSTVTAQGGDYGAGIGAGRNGYLGAGGEADDIDITGKSKVTARGGVGGAGIGGGYDGGSDPVTIDLADTVQEGNDWKYFVKAYGGKGAAGIGSGGVYVDPDDPLHIEQNGHDIDRVSVSGGYVYAKGGDDEHGAGAGIGGGARGGNLNAFKVSGGFIKAEAGYGSSAYAKADDIGTGGEDNRDDLDNDFKITGGTVLGVLSDDPEPIIDGGSVEYRTNKAKNSNKTSVYQTTMQVEEAYYESPDFAVTSQSYYNTNDTISDEKKRLYLYLPVSDENKATATYEDHGTAYDYYGTTKADGNGWLKRGGNLTLIGPIERGDAEPYVGGPEFAVKVADVEGLSSGTKIKFTVTPKVENGVVMTNKTETTPGAQVILKPNQKTEYTVTAETVNLSSDLYWDMKGTYTSAITKELATIEITGDPSKVYDGAAVEDPAVEHNSDATAVQYRYYTAADGGTALERTPSDAGTYYVEAYIEATDNFTEATSARKAFTIKPRPFVMGLTASGDRSDKASVTVTAFGVIKGDDLGTVTVTGTGANAAGSVSKDMELEDADAKGRITETAEFSNIPGGQDYSLTATYSGDNANYICLNTPDGTYHKDYAERTINIALDSNMLTNNRAEAEVGDDSQLLEASTEGTTVTAYDIYTYEVVYNEFLQSETDDPTIQLTQLSGASQSQSTLEYENAGTAIIKVTLKDNRSNKVYRDVETYVEVTVKPDPLTVTSFAYAEGDPDKTPVTEVTYGSVDDLAYGLQFEDKNGTVDGSGLLDVLEPVPLNEKIGVSDADGWPVKIIKTGTFDATEEQLRNYTLTMEEGKVVVNPAPLQINVDDQTVTYGIAQDVEYTYTIGDGDQYGLMLWDMPGTVIASAGPKNNKLYTDYKPGTHSDELEAVLKTPSNYVLTDGGNDLLKEGDLIVEKGRLTIDASIPSKVYEVDENGDAVPVTPVITVEPVNTADVAAMAIPRDPEVTYYRITENADGTASSVKVGEDELVEYESGKDAPANAGEYIAKIKAGDTNYAETQTEVSFRILKALSEPDTPVVEDVRMKDGLRLQDVAISAPDPDNGKPAGGTWEWKDPGQKLEPGMVSAYAIYTPKSDDANNYHPTVRMLRFNVYEVEKGSIAFAEDPSKVYDGVPVADPAVELNTDATTVEYTYYNITGGETNPVKLDRAPTGAGRYRVVASVEATKNYSSAQTEMEFTIEKRPVALQMTAVEVDHPSDSSKVNVTMTVTVLDAAVIDDAEKAVIRLSNVVDKLGDPEDNILLEQPVVEQVNGQDTEYTATFTFTRPADSDYRISAEFPETSNHRYAKVQQSFDAAIGERTVAVYDAADSNRQDELKEIGEKYSSPANEMTIVAVPSAYDTEDEDDTYSNIGNPDDGDGPDHTEPSEDEYIFEIVSDPLGDTVELGKVQGHADQRTLTFKNAGTAIIKVTVTNEAYPSDAVTYLTVTVDPVEVAVQSYAHTKGNPDDEITQIKYGQIETLDFAVKYADGSATPDDLLDALQAVPLDKATGVRAEPYKIGIMQAGISNVNQEMLRNYKIEKEEGSVTVIPANLSITIGDSETPYGIEWDYAYTFDGDGLAEWDRAKDVIKVDEINLQKNGVEVPKNPFPAPDTYDIVGIAATDNPNYSITISGSDQSGTGDPPTLKVTKGNTNIDIHALSKTYDGMPVDIQKAVQPVLSGNITLNMVEDPAKIAKVTYEKWGGLRNGWEPLSEPPVNAGNYRAKVIIKDDKYYNDNESERRFTIDKAQYPIDTPKVPDMRMRDGLKLSDQQLPEGWVWLTPDRSLHVGPVTALAKYTLVDEENYEPVIRQITFEVYDDGVSTGDDVNPALYGFIMMAAAFAAVMAIAFGRRKDSDR